MAETLAFHEAESIDVEAIRGRVKELWEMREDPQGSQSVSDPERFLESCAADFQGQIEKMEAEDQNVTSLGLEDLEAYLEQLKKEVYLAEDKSMKISSEVATLTKAIAEDSMRFDGELEGLACSLKFIDSKGPQGGIPNGRSSYGSVHESLIRFPESYKFEILELDQCIQNGNISLSILQDLDYAHRRVEMIGQIEDILSEVRVVEFEGNCIRLSLKTPIPNLDGLFRGHKLELLMESSVSDHELLIEVADKTLELKNVELVKASLVLGKAMFCHLSAGTKLMLIKDSEGLAVMIFPDDVSLDEILDTMRSSRNLSIPMSGSSLGWLVRQIQHRIFMCMLRRSLVRDANKSRHSFEYLERDDIVTAHLVGGIDAFIKISEGWPISSSALKLVSMKNSDLHSKSISLAFLCKVKDLANSLDLQTRLHPTRFVDAIEEILVKELRTELHSDGISA